MTEIGNSPKTRENKWWQKVLMILLAPIVLPITLILVGLPFLVIYLLSIPITILNWQIEKKRDRRFQMMLLNRGRFMSWNELDPLLKRKGGTILIEWRHKKNLRLWWTSDDVLSMTPLTPPPFEKLDFLGIEQPHPFIAWCHEKYVNEVDGTAILSVYPPHHKTFFRKYSQYLIDTYFNINAINIVSYHVKKTG
jgi:hypothetical protein